MCRSFRYVIFYIILIVYMQIILLTDRDLRTDALINRPEYTPIIDRADAPTAKQVAVIWVSEEGLAPAREKISGRFFISIYL